MAIELFMVELTVTDWPRSVTWYRDVLRLTVGLIDEPNRFTLLTAGSSLVALKAGEARPGTVRLVFQVGDLDAELHRVGALGVTPEAPVKLTPEGYRRATLRDPDGYRIDLFEWVKPPA